MDSVDKVLEFRRKMNELKQSPVKAGGYISPLEGENMLAKGGELVPEVKKVVKGATDVINTSAPLKTITGNAFKDKIQAIVDARRLAKEGAKDLSKGFKSVPFLGPLIAGGLTYAATGDVSAATQAGVPVLNEANDVGPEQGSIEHKLESGQPLTEAERLLLQQRK